MNIVTFQLLNQSELMIISWISNEDWVLIKYRIANENDFLWFYKKSGFIVTHPGGPKQPRLDLVT